MKRKTLATIWLFCTAAMTVLTTSCSNSSGSQDQAASVRYDKLPDGAYAVVAEVRAKPGKEDELRKATLPLVSAVRNEPNNLVYFLQEDRETPGHFIFYEIFKSESDFNAHNNTPHVQAWFKKLPDLADGEVKVVRAELIGNAKNP